MTGAARLSLRDVGLQFGGVRVLDSVSLEVRPSTVFGLVGPNGAGKTSLLNCISRHYQPRSGSISIGEVDVLRLAPWRLASVGLARTFQHPALQLDNTVIENVLLGAHPLLPGGPVRWSMRVPSVRRSERLARERAHELLERFDLDWAASTPGRQLSHGLRKGIELCRALMSEPRLLLLDEPAAGLPHDEVEQLIERIRRLRDDLDLTIVVVEHHMRLIAAVTDRVAVLDHGRMLVEGTATEIQADPAVIEAYLGEGEK